MKNKTVCFICLFFLLSASVFGNLDVSKIQTEVVTIRLEQQYEVLQPGSKSAFAIHFEMAKDWHFYALPSTAPGQMNLKIIPVSEDTIQFSEPVFPEAQLYFDKSSNTKLEVFSDKFTVFLPFTVSDTASDTSVKIGIEGAVCSDIQCRMPDFGELSAVIKIDKNASMDKPAFKIPVVTKSAQTVTQEQATGFFSKGGLSVWFALGLSFVAGLSLNIMPCVWPVLPLIIMRIVEQAKQSKAKSVSMGLAFCLGILLFFACLGGANIILQVFYGTALQWADQFRNPAFLTATALLLIVMALFMFGLFTITVPSSIAGKSGSGKGLAGGVGMGFLAAVLSTPCSFAILATAFAWAQTQHWLLGTLSIMIIGVGMAVPYAILTSMPGLLERLPKAGNWMELFKQAMGFVLLVIAVKLIGALAKDRQINVLYFSVVLAFSVWMWGGWVSFASKLLRKLIVRIIAVILAVVGGLVFLQAPAAELIDWQSYDSQLIENAKSQDRPVLIKFTADWCLSCQVAEKMVYSREDVAGLIEQKNVLAIKADTTTKDMPATIALKEIYKEPGVPVSMLYVPGQKKFIRWHEMSFADELKKALVKLPSK